MENLTSGEYLITHKANVNYVIRRCIISKVDLEELEMLDILLTPYKESDSEWWDKQISSLKQRFKQLDTVDPDLWPWPRKPSWPDEYMRLLIKLARKNDLLTDYPVETWE